MKYRERRKPTDFEVVLLTQASRKAVVVKDVSAKGIRIDPGNVHLEIEDDVEVEVRDRRYPSRVSWVKRGEAGLEFDRPLPADVIELVARARKNVKGGRFLFGR